MHASGTQDGRRTIAIGICTRKRPLMLSRCLDSLLRLEYPSGADTVVIIVENDKDQDASESVNAFIKRTDKRVSYHVEPRTGLVSARNRLLEEALNAGADYLAGFDDDAAARPDWLVNLLRVRDNADATVVTGAEKKEQKRRWDIDAPLNFREGDVLKYFDTNNYLIDLDFIRQTGLRFDYRFNLVGGEGIDFGRNAFLHGAKIVWTNSAAVDEMPKGSRDTARRALLRYFCRGQAEILMKQKYRGYGRLRMTVSVFFNLITRTLSLPFYALSGRESLTRRLMLVCRTLGAFCMLVNIRLYSYSQVDGE